MTTLEAIISILVMAGVTFLTRLAPFALFGRGGRPPRVVTYLGQVLPPAVIAMLIIYCLKNIDLFAGSHGLPEAIAVALTVILQATLRNLLLTIAAGTIGYMLLVQYVFA